MSELIRKGMFSKNCYGPSGRRAPTQLNLTMTAPTSLIVKAVLEYVLIYLFSMYNRGRFKRGALSAFSQNMNVMSRGRGSNNDLNHSYSQQSATLSCWQLDMACQSLSLELHDLDERVGSKVHFQQNSRVHGDHKPWPIAVSSNDDKFWITESSFRHPHRNILQFQTWGVTAINARRQIPLFVIRVAHMTRPGPH